MKNIIYKFKLDGTLVQGWTSLREASKSLNIPIDVLDYVASTDNTTLNGYSYQYLSINKEVRQSSVTKKVYQYSKDGELIREWVSASEAARSLDGSRADISKCCKGQQKSAYGYLWSFEKK